MKRERGRPKKIESPEMMWALFQDYIKKVKKNPYKVDDWVGGIGKKVIRKKERPITMEGFDNHCFEIGVIGDVGHYFSNLNGAYSDFLPICSRIKRYIRDEQINGGMAGIYNPSITQRLNNLVEKTENKHEVSEIIIKREG